MKKRIIFPFLLLLLFACELVVDIDVPFEQAQLTLNTYFSPDSLWNAYLSLNQHVLDDGPYRLVDNARIIIYEEDIPIDTLINKGNGIYQSDTERPTAGKRYKITADATGYGSISAESYLPSPVQIANATFSEIENTIDQELRIKMEIKDPMKKNYYQVLLEREREYYDFHTETVRTTLDRMYLTSEDPAIQNENEEFDNDITFNDLLFNGKEINFTFSASQYGGSGFASTTLILKTLSEDYYNYVNTSSLQKNTSGDPFAQPVNIYNNIQNGFGVFAGYSIATFAKSIPRPVISNISPVAAKAGDHVIITGENFISDPENYISVYFKGNPYLAYAPVVQSSNNQLEVVVPVNAVTGKIIIENGRVVISETDFLIIN